MLSLSILVLVCFTSSTIATSELAKPHYDLEDAELLFKDFLEQYSKTYNRFEYSERLEIFKENLKFINSQNAKHPNTVFAVNHFADLRPDEQQQYFGQIPLNTAVPVPKVTHTAEDIVDNRMPVELDWRKSGLVSHVKNQGACKGSASIFSAMGAIEGRFAIEYGYLFTFSEGQALDCTEHGTCDLDASVYPHVVMQELRGRAGLMREEDYPYKPEKSKCKEDHDKMPAILMGGDQLNVTSEDELKKLLVLLGPLSVSMSPDDLLFYTEGILHPDKCKNQKLCHPMLLVGYGEENGIPFWILKQSWGEKWGEEGYVRLLRGVNACNIATCYSAYVTYCSENY